MTEKRLSFSLVNGRFLSDFSVDDRGLAYGDGLFETMRMERGCIPLLKMHLDRLERGCHRLSIPFESHRLKSDLELLLKSAVDTCLNLQLQPVGLVKIIYTRGEGGSGYSPPKSSLVSPSIVLSVKIQPLISRADTAGVTLHTCLTRLPLLPQLAEIKHLNRLQYVLAALEVPDGECNHGLLLDVKDRVIETLHHNVFMLKGGVLYTPNLSQSGVAGVMRSLLVDKLIPENFPDLKQKESDLTLDDLRGSDEVFLSNSVRGVWHLSEFENSYWDKGPLVTRLQQLISDIWSG